MAEQNEHETYGGGEDKRRAELQAEAGSLESQVAALEEEVALLRRRLADAPKRVRTLEERLWRPRANCNRPSRRTSA